MKKHYYYRKLELLLNVVSNFYKQLYLSNKIIHFSLNLAFFSSSKDKFELWKKKVAASKPKPKPMVDDDFDELDGKYYMKNKLD